MEIKDTFDKRFIELKNMLNSYINGKKLPYLLSLVYHKGEIVYCDKMGHLNQKGKLPVNYNNIFRLASMTKPIIAVATLILLDQGKFSLESPAENYVPKIKNIKVCVKGKDGNYHLEDPKHPVTILELLTHTAGFSDGTDPNHPSTKAISDYIGEKGIKISNKSLEEGVDGFLDIPLYAHPGERWIYGNIGFSVLGNIIENVSGQKLDIFLKTNIFDPLEMKDTDFFIHQENIHLLTPLFTHGETGELIEADTSNESLFTKPKYLQAGGGLVSTLGDYLKFCLMLIHHGKFKDVQILKPETIELMMQDQVLKRNIKFPDFVISLPDHIKHNMNQIMNGCFGLGVQVSSGRSGVPAGVTSWIGLFTTIFYVDPKNEVVALLFSQYLPWFIYPLFYDFLTLLFKSLSIKFG